MRVDLTPLSAEPRSLAHRELADPVLGERLDAVLAQGSPVDWTPSGATRELYLDAMERIVRMAVGWQDASGAIIDPVEQRECGQTTPRFAAPGAILLGFGRCDDLREPILRAMDYACRRLAAGEAASPDFWMRELVTAWHALREQAPAARLAGWRRDLCAVVPERTYSKVSPDGRGIAALRNWTIYAAAGEVMREGAGLAPQRASIVWGERFFDKYMPYQFSYFTGEGMYRDPGDPITYDITTRLQVACALAFGYRGALRPDFDELLRRGSRTMLLFLSPDGFVPFGGRSAAYHFREVIVAAHCELEARRYREANPRLAGAFKRQAHRSGQALQPWLGMEPPRHIKNGYPPGASHGFDPYGVYSVYSLLAASFLGLAALFADDTIAEAPAPSELGGYGVHLAPAFHKLCLSTRRSQAVIDTGAQQQHDATGLGRFTVAGLPLALGPGAPISGEPHFRLPEELRAAHPVAVAVEWRDGEATLQRLAATAEDAQAAVEIVHESADRVEAVARWELPGATCVRCHYSLTEGSIGIRASVHIGGAEASDCRLTVPLLVTDGDTDATIARQAGAHTVDWRGARLTVSYPREAACELEGAAVGNRLGAYRVLRVASSTLTLSLA